MIKPNITEDLVSELIAEQFPEYAHLSIRSVKSQGNDNRTFNLGDKMLVRLPSAEKYAAKVVKEQKWLLILAPHLSLPIPTPLHLGAPSQNYPWNWSIYNWIEGDSANALDINDLESQAIALDLAKFLNELQKIDITGAPVPGKHNFYRGASPKVYDEEARYSIKSLRGFIDTDRATAIWEKAVSSKWDKDPVWIHGDLAVGNILIKNKKLSAVIDFSAICVGDPACDLVIAWNSFTNKSRQIFKEQCNLDADTWDRAKGWALWKAMLTVNEIEDKNGLDSLEQLQIINEVINE